MYFLNCLHFLYFVAFLVLFWTFGTFSNFGFKTILGSHLIYRQFLKIFKFLYKSSTKYFKVFFGLRYFLWFYIILFIFALFIHFFIFFAFLVLFCTFSTFSTFGTFFVPYCWFGFLCSLKLYCNPIGNFFFVFFEL